MTKYTSFLLDSLEEGQEFQNMDSIMYEAGMTTSKSHASRLISEIKRRLLIQDTKLPQIDILSSIGLNKLTSLVQAQIYFTYLYYADEILAHVTNKLGDIYVANIENPMMSRDEIKGILENYFKVKSEKPSEKSRRNWLGRYLSIMRETNLLVRRKGNEYLLNFLGVQPETFVFFSLHDHFNGNTILEGNFLKATQLRDELLPRYLKKLDTVKNVIYKTHENEKGLYKITIETGYTNLYEWIEDV
ncbi:MAG: hypothetical protein ACTSUE_00165 [Promethearchaeota archaeon]